MTFIVGENGTGKSTLLEGLAVFCDLPVIGSESPKRDPSFIPARRLASAMKPVWNIRTRRGLFFRAEDFFSFIRGVKKDMKELDNNIEEYERTLSGYGLQLARGSMEGQKHALTSKYGDEPEARSHGEAFLNIFQQRIVPGGLYIMDEPEVPLSPLRQLALISLIMEQQEQSQFIIATHSPMIMAIPGASILCIDSGDIVEKPWDEIGHVQLYRQFMEAPERFIRNLNIT